MIKDRAKTGTSVLGCSSMLSGTPIDMTVKWLKPTNWWEDTRYNIGALLFLSIADIANLYVVLADALYSKQIFLFFITLAMCLTLTLLPFFTVQLVRKRQYGQYVPKAIFMLLPVIFAIMVVFLCWLRFSTRYSEFGMESFMSFGGSATDFQTSSPAATPLAAIVSFFPVLTAIFSALIGFMSEDPMVKKLRNINIKRILLKETENQLGVFIAEYMINNEGTRLADEDDEKYASAVSSTDAIGKSYKDFFRISLAEHLANSTATSHITGKKE